MEVESVIFRDTVAIITIDLVERILAIVDAFADDYVAFGKAAADKYVDDMPSEEVVRICYSLRQLFSVRGVDGLLEFMTEMRDDLEQPTFPFVVTKN